MATSERESSIRRGIEIMLALADQEALDRGGLGVTDVAALLGREKSQVSRALKAFHQYGFVDRNEDGTYRLGWRLYTLAQLAGEPRMLKLASPLLRSLAASVGERAHLSVLQGTEALTVLSESPGRSVEAVGWAGRLTPAYCTSAGRALLLDMLPDGIERMFANVEFVAHGPRTASGPKQLAERIAQAQERGYAIADEEFEADLVGIAVPIYAAPRRLVASLNVSGPRYRLLERADEVAHELIELAGWLSRELGGAELTPAGAG